MTRDELLALADRCEKADAGSRELDLAICIALNTGRSTDPRRPGAPHYTSSIDAALMLVPKGMVYLVSNVGLKWASEPVIGRATAVVGLPDETSDRFSREASTPALAICAATLRARAEEV